MPRQCALEPLAITHLNVLSTSPTFDDLLAYYCQGSYARLLGGVNVYIAILLYKTSNEISSSPQSHVSRGSVLKLLAKNTRRTLQADIQTVATGLSLCLPARKEKSGHDTCQSTADTHRSITLWTFLSLFILFRHLKITFIFCHSLLSSAALHPADYINDKFNMINLIEFEAYSIKLNNRLLLSISYCYRFFDCNSNNKFPNQYYLFYPNFKKNYIHLLLVLDLEQSNLQAKFTIYDFLVEI